MTVVASADPFTGEPVFQAEETAVAELERVLTRARAGAARWRLASSETRAAALHRFADGLDAQCQTIAELMVREVGKLRGDAYAEVSFTALSARWYADHPPLSERAGEALVERRPLGVIAAITPWNVPLITPAWKWLPALMAGNAVVWKPSEIATGVATATHDLLLAAGVPDDVMQLVPGGAPTAQALAEDDRVDGLHFTGSEGAGRSLLALAEPRGARAAVEMSGVNPAIVLADADLDLAAQCIVDCATALAGQKCTATRRTIVDERVRAPLLECMAMRVEALVAGDPRNPRTTLGPLISRAAREGADQVVAEAVARGAKLVGRTPVGDGPPTLFGATVLAGIASDDPLREREVFAPVITVESFADRADAWRLANATPYGLSAAVYTRNAEVANEAARELRSGVVAVNRRGDDVAVEAPFGGVKRSGNGVAEGGRFGYEAVTELQAIYGLP